MTKTRTDLVIELAAGERHLKRMKQNNTVFFLVMCMLTSALPFVLLMEDSTPGGVANAALFLALMVMPTIAVYAINHKVETDYQRQLDAIRSRLTKTPISWTEIEA